jgi:DNA-binding NtrC family response regulator
MVIAELEKTPLRNLLFRHEIVLVDDDPAVLRALRRLLRDEPYDILTTDQPPAALRWVGEREVNLVVTDELMPGMEGHDLVEEVHARSPRTACVILTGYPLTAMSVPGLREGIHAMITKPWDDEMIRRIIRQLLWEQEYEELGE